VRSLRQFALYEKKSMYNTYSKSSSYQKLGSISKLEDENSPLLAMSEHDAEQETILDIVGHRGKVNIHWPQELEEFLDENEWGKVEDTTSPSKEGAPLPGATDRTLDVSFVPLTSNGRRRLKVSVTKTGTIADLRHKVAEVMNTKAYGNEPIDANNLVITDFYNNEVFSYLNDEDEIDKIRDNDVTFVFQLTSLASIHLHELEIENAKKKDHDEENHGLDKRLVYLLDSDIIDRLNNGEGWHFGLEKYLIQPMSLTTLLNQRRGNHEERMCFHQKASKFFCECYSCIEFEAQTKEKSQELSENQHKKRKSSISGIDLQFSLDDENYDNDCTEVLSSTEIKDKNQQSLATLCETSIVFHGVKTVKDVATLKFCLSKFMNFLRKN